MGAGFLNNMVGTSKPVAAPKPAPGNDENTSPALQKLGNACSLILITAWTFNKLGGPDFDPKHLAVWKTCNKMMTLSYELPDGRYGVGVDDCYTVLTLVLGLLSARSLLASWVWLPLASKVGAMGKKFEIQGWQFTYYSCSWPWGFYLYWNSVYFMDHYATYEGYPHQEFAADFKLYYLTGTAFWLQMLAVTITEPWEKDFWQMMAHHVCSIGLTSVSWATGFVRLGHVVLLNMDTADILLPLAKMLRYAGRTILCDVAFGLFAVVWIVTRHGFYFTILSHQTWAGPAQLEAAGIFVKYPNLKTPYYLMLSWMYILQGLLLFWLSHLLTAVHAAMFGKKGASDIDITTDVVDDRAVRQKAD